MQAVVLEAFGGPENLRPQAVPDPSPGPGEVLIALGAADVIGPVAAPVAEPAVGGKIAGMGRCRLLQPRISPQTVQSTLGTVVVQELVERRVRLHDNGRNRPASTTDTAGEGDGKTEKTETQSFHGHRIE